MLFHFCPLQLFISLSHFDFKTYKRKLVNCHMQVQILVIQMLFLLFYHLQVKIVYTRHFNNSFCHQMSNWLLFLCGGNYWRGYTIKYPIGLISMNDLQNGNVSVEFQSVVTQPCAFLIEIEWRKELLVPGILLKFSNVL